MIYIQDIELLFVFDLSMSRAESLQVYKVAGMLKGKRVWDREAAEAKQCLLKEVDFQEFLNQITTEKRPKLLTIATVKSLLSKCRLDKNVLARVYNMSSMLEASYPDGAKRTAWNQALLDFYTDPLSYFDKEESRLGLIDSKYYAQELLKAMRTQHKPFGYIEGSYQWSASEHAQIESEGFKLGPYNKTIWNPKLMQQLMDDNIHVMEQFNIRTVDEFINALYNHHEGAMLCLIHAAYDNPQQWEQDKCNDQPLVVGDYIRRKKRTDNFSNW